MGLELSFWEHLRLLLKKNPKAVDKAQARGSRVLIWLGVSRYCHRDHDLPNDIEA